MRELPLTRGMVALVDDADFVSVVAAGPWHVSVRRRVAYAYHHVRTPGGKKTKQSLHAFLTGWPLTDHRNGNGLDNQRCNLRPANRAQNAANAPLRVTNTSGFRGVSWHKQRRYWVARIRNGTGTRYLGVFPTPEAAARAYDSAARALHGEFARPNFQEQT